MTAFNFVRMRVKPGREGEFLELHRTLDKGIREAMKKNGLRRMGIVKTGERSYSFFGEWDSMDGLVKARPDMIKSLDRIRGLLEDLGGDLGVTDPVSGEMVMEI